MCGALEGHTRKFVQRESKMRRISVVLGLVACVSARAQTTFPIGCGEATVEINACVEDRRQKADNLLITIFGVVLKELSAGTDEPNPIFNSERKRTLVAAERDWTKFKDTQCAAVAALVAPGTAAPAIYDQCQIDLINERIRFLRSVAEQIHWDSKLCRANKANCVLPTDPP